MLRNGLSAEPTRVSMRTSSAILGVLEDVATEAMSHSFSDHKARTLGYLASIALKALEVGEFEQRLTALEENLRLGKA